MNYHPDLFSTALRMLMALGIVLGGLLLVFYIAKRMLRREVGGSKEKLIRVLGNYYIGVKKSISLVEMPGAILVLGITSDNITLLSRIEDKEILNQFKRIEPEKMPLSFLDQLHKLSSKFKQGEDDGG